MCGIAGFSGDFDPALLERMSAALAQRGPDDHGSLHLPDADLGLAHRRLSIIDLSARGHQPMWDVTRTVAITYNGEIYNYRELRDELITDGYGFNSDCDTEVILNLYLRDGDKLLERLNGIFAFAIWDTRSKSLLVARDGVGVKPLYYAETPKGFLFASELKALMHEPSLDRTLDHQAIRHHLLYLWCPAPLTMLRAVRKLEPGHAMRVKAGRVTKRWRFYDLPLDQEFVDWPEADAIVQVRKYLTRAVDRQLVADVPVGAFLSGGLDSSTVVALAQRRYGQEEAPVLHHRLRGRRGQRGRHGRRPALRPDGGRALERGSAHHLRRPGDGRRAPEDDLLPRRTPGRPGAHQRAVHHQAGARARHQGAALRRGRRRHLHGLSPPLRADAGAAVVVASGSGPPCHERRLRVGAPDHRAASPTRRRPFATRTSRATSASPATSTGSPQTS